MDALTLGTGSADGWPNPFCTCASCAAERAAGRVRGQTSVLVDGRLLLDLGPETPRAAERLGADLSRLEHVLITHAHPDHCSPAMLLFRSWAGDGPLDVVGPPEVVEACRMWVAPDSPVRFRAVAAGDRLRLGGYDVAVLAARHGADGTAVLYDVASDTGRLLYATDTAALPEETVRALAGTGLDLVLMEETFGDVRDHGTDHLDLGSFPDQLRRLRAVGAVTDATDVVAVHLSHHNPPTAELARRLADWGARVVDDGARVTVGGDAAGPDGTGSDAARRPAAEVASAQPAAGVGSAQFATDVGSVQFATGVGRAQSATGVATGPRTTAPAAGATPRTSRGEDRRTLVIGGTRSGKSREAERLLAAEPAVTYVATSYPSGGDAEWDERIRRHRADRPGHWRTVETLDLVGLLADEGEPLLVDCLTLWLTRVMDRYDAWDDEVWATRAEKEVAEEVDALVTAWRQARRRVVAVTNEVGQGVVPDTPAGRRFRDLMGRLNAAVAAQTEDVRWCVAGRVGRL